MASLESSKAELRREMRRLRGSLPDRSKRSSQICDAVLSLPHVADAAVVMGFASLPGEPDMAPLVGALDAVGVVWVVPETPALDPVRPDVVIVPGLAFTLDGGRLGQGGGWYDRFLPRRRPDCLMVGVCFTEQLRSEVPTAAHDVQLDLVIHR